MRGPLLPHDLGWIDSASTGPVTAIATPQSSRAFVYLALYWNASIKREVTLDGAVATDAFYAPGLKIGRDGRLLNTTDNILLDRTVAIGVVLERIGYRPGRPT